LMLLIYWNRLTGSCRTEEVWLCLHLSCVFIGNIFHQFTSKQLSKVFILLT